MVGLADQTMSGGRNTLKSLQRKQAALLSQQQALIKDRQRLLLRQALLTAWCEALTLLQQKQGQSQPPTAAEGDPDIHQHFQQLLDDEIKLLGELTLSEQLSSCSLGTEAALLDPGPDTLSPGVCNSNSSSR